MSGSTHKGRHRPVAAISVGGVLALAALALIASAGSATAAEERVGLWRFAERADGSKAIPEGNNYRRGAAQLADGRVLVAGGFVYDSASRQVDLYDPAVQEWESAAEMNEGRRRANVVALPDGRALVAGGGRIKAKDASAEVYDPDDDSWTHVPSPMSNLYTATLLEDGTVLATGRGGPIDDLPAAAVFDPSVGDGTWTLVEQPAAVAESEAATRMDGGEVLVARPGGTGDVTAEVYDPSGRTWRDVSGDGAPDFAEPPLVAGLVDGRALVVSDTTASLFEPGTDTWEKVGGDVTVPRRGERNHDIMTLLDDGTVLLTGSREAELFDPTTEEFELAGHAIPRNQHTATRLGDVPCSDSAPEWCGTVLVTGGRTLDGKHVVEADLYLPPHVDADLQAPTIDQLDPTVDLVEGGANVTIEGRGLAHATDVNEPGVTFGGAPAEFEVEHHGRLIAHAPAHEQASVPVRVRTPAGTTPDGPQTAFDYVLPAGVWSPAGADGASLALETAPLWKVRAASVGGGNVLIVYGDTDFEARAEIYNAATQKLEPTEDPPLQSMLGPMVLLDDGRALLVGSDGLAKPAAAVYDPETEEWEKTASGGGSPHRDDSATLLPDGRVLVVSANTSHIYDPEEGSWNQTLDQPYGQGFGETTRGATLTSLADGRVLLAGGGKSGTDIHGEARIFDPASEQWSEAAELGPRGYHAAARLDDGEVLAAGGISLRGSAWGEGRGTEVFMPDEGSGSGEGSWTDAQSLAGARSQYSMTKLADGTVLAAGGVDDDNSGQARLASAEVYRPENGRWEPTAALVDPRRRHGAVRLDEGCASKCGNVLVVGGTAKARTAEGDDPDAATTTLELYTPRPRVDSVESARGPLEGGDQVTITGQFFAGVDSVSFGEVPSDDVEVVSQTEIVAEVPPAGSNGPVPVTVTNEVPMGGGETEALAAFRDEAPMFTYVSEAGRVDDLTGQAPAEGTVKLSWSAVDDGTASPADEYVVAQSVEPIGDAGDFADAFALCGGVCDHFDPRPQAIGDPVTLTVEQLQPGTTYHYAVAPIDADGERGPISDAVSVTTLGTDSGEESPSDDDGTTGDGGTGDGGTGDGGGGTTDADSVQEAAEAGGGVVRLAGADRIATSVEASREAFGDGEAGAVVLARADEFADGLAGVPLARVVDGPLLLTHSGELDDRVANELQRLLAEGGDVWMLGGRAALNDQVEQRVTELGFTPQRLAGNDRFETAAVIAEHGLGAPDQVLVATGGDFADAVTAGAAASQVQGAVVLSAGDQLPAVTSDYLSQHDPAEVFAIGGPAAAAVPDAAPLVGATRFETAAAVADQFFADPSTVGLATGMRFPDALSGGSHIARYGGPMLLSGPDRLHSAAEAYMAGRAATIDAGVVYGGTAALTSGVADGLAAAITADS